MEKNKIIILIVKIVIIFLMLVGACCAFIVAQDYIKDQNAGKLNFVINNNNVTAKLKKEIYYNENGDVYVSKEDLKNYFDEYLYYDKENKKVVTTSDTKVAKLEVNKKSAIVNGKEVNISSPVIEKDDTVYVPITVLKDVYNLEIENKNNEIIVVTSLNREQIQYDVAKNVSVKYKAKVLSKTEDKVKKDGSVIWVAEAKNGWSKVRTENGKVGYVKTKDLINKKVVRQKQESKKQIDGKVSIVWDYYSEYVSAPNREGTTIEGINVVSPSFFSLKQGDTVAINNNAARGGLEYINWAKQNGYKVWAMFSNNSMRETTSKILNSEEQRDKLIKTIVELAKQYQLDGINIDFENMNMSDKNVFSQFIIELAPRLRDINVITSVDVTAPDGSENWSLCYNRNVLGKVADYLVFMAYDQYGSADKKAGTTAGYNWVETNINKFLGQEEVKPEKIIMGMPLYTRLWKTNTTKEDSVTSTVVNMNKVEQQIPDGVEKQWDNDLKQNYIEYTQGNTKYQMWIEDAKSIREKLGLITKYNLAGGAYWEKDREVDEVWTITKEILEIK